MSARLFLEVLSFDGTAARISFLTDFWGEAPVSYSEIGGLELVTCRWPFNVRRPE